MSSNRSLADKVHQFWRALDMRDYDTLISLVAEDCTWQREMLVQGRDAIRQELQARPSGLLTRHLISNLVISDDGEPAADFVITTFGTMADAEQAGPPDCGGPALIADVRMRFAALGDQHFIAGISNQIIFRKAQPNH